MPRCSAASAVNARAMAWKASKSVRVCHGGSIAGVNACTNGCMSVLERSCFSYQVAAGSTTSENSVVEVIRKSSDAAGRACPPAPRRATSRRCGRCPRAPRSARSERVGAEQVAQEVLVALGRRAEQVGPPHGRAPAASSPGRPGPCRRTAGRRTSAGRRRAGDRPARGGRLVGDVERVAVERAGTTASSPSGPTARAGRPCLARRTAPARCGPTARRRRSRRSATGRCAGTSTRCRSSAAAGGDQSRPNASCAQPVTGRHFSWPDVVRPAAAVDALAAGQRGQRQHRR